MWNSINKLIDPNFKKSSSDLSKNFEKGKRGKKSKDKKRKFKNRKKFNFKNKKKFFKKKFNKETGYTNNPNFIGKKPSDSSSLDGEKKRFNFKGKKKFKNRKNRSKKFTFKKYNKKRR
jgi:hypothetical protein